MVLPDSWLRGLARGLPLLAVAVLAWAGWLARLDRIDARSPNFLMVPLQVEQVSLAEVYFDVGQGLWAGDVSQQNVVPRQEPMVRFALPREPIAALRLDPMMGPGGFAVGAPWLESATGRVIARFPSSAVTPRLELATWEARGDWYEATAVVGATDPQVWFGLGTPLRHARGRPWGWWLLGALALIGLRTALGRTEAVRTRVRWHRVVPRWLGGTVRTGARWVWRALVGFSVGATRVTTGRVLVGAVVVVAAQAWQLRGIGEGIDWPMWDEANFAGRGADWAAGRGVLGELHTGPGFALQYGVLSWWGEAGQTVIWQHGVVKLAVALMLYLALVRLWRNPGAAAAATVAWAATWFQLQYPTLLYQAAWVWFLAAVAVIDRWPLVGTLLLAWAVAYRQDYQFALVAVVGWLGWMWWRDRKAGGRGVADFWIRGQARRGESVVVALAVLTLLLGLGALLKGGVTWGGVGHRGWFAFQQHYAVQTAMVRGLSDFNPYAQYPELIAQDFPGATSLREAWAVNPGAMLRHVQWNLANAAGEVVEYWRPAWGLAWVVGLGGALAVLWLVAGGAQTRRGAGGSTKVEPYIKASSGAVVLLLGGLLVVGPGLVVLAKESYLLPALALTLGGAGLALTALARWWPERGRLVLAGLGGVVALSVVGVVVATPAVFVAHAQSQPVATTAKALAAVWPAEGRYVLVGYGASTYETYLGRDRARGVEPVNAVSGNSGPNRTMAQLLEEERPWAVLVTDAWRQAADVDDNLLRERVATGRWAVRPVPGGELYYRLAR
ncbi:hypothetical protein [Actomonas aquatica]|uniref:Glycosyltransferase RgtA/B/C/D-like domain-containing protein n=1 Tax=Actomonas aquatica TaxID=2866162 RepID=A0ABZ1C6P0_9BACT|nr:hypothetical protein [Opitutus sp. WL0086]WRQ87259.1 hypothetical protein K1X11_020795 [Opitutus sp. WL0086]